MVSLLWIFDCTTVSCRSVIGMQTITAIRFVFRLDALCLSVNIIQSLIRTAMDYFADAEPVATTYRT